MTLEASGITQNTRFNVDETNAVSNSDSESVGDDFRDAPSSPTPSQDPQYESLEQKCERIRDNLLQEKTVLVRRENLIEDVLDAYRGAGDIFLTKFRVPKGRKQSNPLHQNRK
ncbi:hypothetical protein DPMN_105972 [Dreissena polymorpha]|uniref:Uncharacterized protein n=1 Tax=Dreissena polymorpha TaxID=45954 RepID=A0A9D4QIA1_DREPO|nr:hypothetical protein DPMN_105972 [Dreissena polymorpha]